MTHHFRLWLPICRPKVWAVPEAKMSPDAYICGCASHPKMNLHIPTTIQAKQTSVFNDCHFDGIFSNAMCNTWRPLLRHDPPQQPTSVQCACSQKLRNHFAQQEGSCITRYEQNKTENTQLPGKINASFKSSKDHTTEEGCKSHPEEKE
jgi:hypothetical protein